jgi:hypothetical protein
LSFIHHEIKANRIATHLPKLKKCLIIAAQKGLISLNFDEIEAISVEKAIEYLSPFL